MTKHPAFGANMFVDWAGGTVWAALAQVRDIAGPNISRSDIQTTDHDSDDGWHEYLGGRAEPGALTFPIGWDPTDTVHMQGAGTGFIANFDDDTCTMPAWKVETPLCGGGTVTLTFDGYMNGFTPTTPVDGFLTADLSVKLAGKPTFVTT